MLSKRITLWRWAKTSKKFTPSQNEYFTSRKIRFKSHNNVVRAGLNPLDWMEIFGEEVLHKIVLTKEQAEECVVAEALFRPTEEEITKFIETRNISPIGSIRKYSYVNYEKSFVSLLDYSGHYNLPEVLIPFEIKAERVIFQKAVIL